MGSRSDLPKLGSNQRNHMIMLTGVGKRRLTKGALVAILVLIACDSCIYACRRIQAIKAEIRMRTELRHGLEDVILAAEEVARNRKPGGQ
jgi:hypothetical protein